MSARLARWATALAVLAVAVIAAIVSYAHIESLALANGYSIDTARLLPFSVDGLILASSLSLATGGRVALARAGLVLGVAATVAANIMFGVRFGITGAVVNSWPAVAFIVSSEILVGMLRARPAPVTEGVPESVPLTVTVDTAQAVTGETPVDVSETVADTVPASTVSPRRGGRARTVAARPAPTRIDARRKPDPVRVFAADLAAGKVPSLRAIKEKCHVGTPTAQEIRARLVAMTGVPEAA
ncbi:MAG TPA: DUF2637 domain-containing protein [Trebonia sp.]|nr:DUF2637 domain-containing protein [Trebonia sp.]